jgi:hypothetical protein
MTAAGAGREGLAGEHQVDAQAMVAAECEHAVVPPAEGLRRLLQVAENIAQAEFDERRAAEPLEQLGQAHVQ